MLKCGIGYCRLQRFANGKCQAHMVPSNLQAKPYWAGPRRLLLCGNRISMKAGRGKGSPGAKPKNLHPYRIAVRAYHTVVLTVRQYDTVTIKGGRSTGLY